MAEGAKALAAYASTKLFENEAFHERRNRAKIPKKNPGREIVQELKIYV
jgi:hypothetical protein